ncbi:hypothetical protein niasHS_008328 [Heterodera schachtii]|uniref:Uncharacterized protein n=1 Tax=Heterodera schachtii TaxID=97005 RepID=A0ABD2J3I2_HETSC
MVDSEIMVDQFLEEIYQEICQENEQKKCQESEQNVNGTDNWPTQEEDNPPTEDNVPNMPKLIHDVEMIDAANILNFFSEHVQKKEEKTNGETIVIEEIEEQRNCGQSIDRKGKKVIIEISSSSEEEEEEEEEDYADLHQKIIEIKNGKKKLFENKRKRKVKYLKINDVDNSKETVPLIANNQMPTQSKGKGSLLKRYLENKEKFPRRTLRGHAKDLCVKLRTLKNVRNKLKNKTHYTKEEIWQKRAFVIEEFLRVKKEYFERKPNGTIKIADRAGARKVGIKAATIKQWIKEMDKRAAAAEAEIEMKSENDKQSENGNEENEIGR